MTLQILREAKEAGLPAVWPQLGSFDDEGLQFVKREFRAGVVGTEGHGGEGWGVLVNGDWALQSAHEAMMGKR